MPAQMSIDIDDAVRITFTHPVNAFDPALSLCLRPQPWPDAPAGTTEACLAGSFELIEDDFGSFNTLEFVGDWRLEYGRTYELTLNHVSSIGGSVIENTTPSMVFLPSVRACSTAIGSRTGSGTSWSQACATC